MIQTRCRAKDGPATCRTHGAQEVERLYQVWRNGDMEDNDGRWERAQAYMSARDTWGCREPIRVSSISSDTGSEIIPCHLQKNHAGKHDPYAREPWA